MGLYEWAVGRNYRWVGYECRMGAEGEPIRPTDYLPRRLMGEYLVWFYDTLLADAPPNLEVVRHYAAATDISPEIGGRETVLARQRRVDQASTTWCSPRGTPGTTSRWGAPPTSAISGPTRWSTSTSRCLPGRPSPSPAWAWWASTC